MNWILTWGVRWGYLDMFLRKKKNKPSSTSVQIISKDRGDIICKKIGSSDNEQEIQKLIVLARQEIERLNPQHKLFISKSYTVFEHVLKRLAMQV